MDKVISLAMGIAMMFAVQGELKEVRWWLLQQIYKHRKLGSLEEYTQKLTGTAPLHGVEFPCKNRLGVGVHPIK